MVKDGICILKLSVLYNSYRKVNPETHCIQFILLQFLILNVIWCRDIFITLKRICTVHCFNSEHYANDMIYDLFVNKKPLM